MSGSASSLFHEGRLQDAIAAGNAAVRKSPTDVSARVLLAELLLFSGNLERADVVLDAAGQIEPDIAIVIAEFRQLLRAETARRQVRHDGRIPEFLGEPTAAQQAALAAWVAWRAGDAAAAARHAAEMEALRPRAPCTRDGLVCDDFRDACDLHAGFFEVLTTTGKYFWIPTERVQTIEFHKPTRPRDLAWRRASMSVRDGPDGVVYLPATYGSDDAGLPDLLRLGRETDWQERGGLVCGTGLRMFLAGEDAVDIMALGDMAFPD